MHRTAFHVARRYRAALVREHGDAFVEERVLDDVADRARGLIDTPLARPTIPVPEIIERLAEIVVEAERAERLIPF